MEAERWVQVDSLLQSALGYPPDERDAFLREACNGDLTLEREVRSLLVAHEKAGNFLESPAIEIAPPTFDSLSDIKKIVSPSHLGSAIIRPNMPLAPGTKLDGYEVLSFLGAGGMGEVYRARDFSLKREVAIKVLPAFVSRDPNRLSRFEQEAQATAALNHPNILAVHQFGKFDGSSYLVSELLEGGTLRQLLKRGPLPVRKAIDYGVQIAYGLAAAHEKGIVHRDLKPENLFITKDGHVKILDFGLAKLMPREREPDATAATAAHETDPGMVMGTVGYMSPEQVRGETVDHRTDVFAFGAILYEMLAGKRAFQRSTSAETMTAILNEEPPAVSQVGRDVSPGLQRLVHRCLEKNPEQRFHSASDLAFALEALSDSGSLPPRIEAPKSSRRVLPWALVVLVVTALAAAWYLLQSWVKHPQPSSSPLEIIPLTESGYVVEAAVTPDGRYVAYVNREHGHGELRLLQVATRRDVQLLPGSPLSIMSLHFSPDGNFIYFLQQLKGEDKQALGVFRIATLGGPATPLANDAGMYSVTVSPDGKQVAYISKTATESLIVSVDRDGANRRILAKRPISRQFWFIEWSPSTDQLAAVASGDDDMGLVGIDLPAGSIRNLSVSGFGAIGQPVWYPNGATIFAPTFSRESATMQIWAFDARTGSHRPLTSGSANFSEYSLSATATGDLVALTDEDNTSLWVTDHVGQAHAIPSMRGEGDDGAIWVQGRIVSSNMWEMVVHDADGRNPTRLKAYSPYYRQLAPCGTGHVVYLASDATHGMHIARTDIATGSTVALTAGPVDGEPTCTLDGSTLVYVQCTDHGTRCFLTRKSLDSEQTAILHEINRSPETQVWPTVSSDGANVLWREINGAESRAWVNSIPLAGGELRKTRLPVPVPAEDVTIHKNLYKWAPDGKSIYYSQTDQDGTGNIWSAPLDGKPPRKITNFDSDVIFAFDVSPDNRLIVVRGKWMSDAVLIKNAE
jgi:serine/threonine protein kinase